MGPFFLHFLGYKSVELVIYSRGTNELKGMGDSLSRNIRTLRPAHAEGGRQTFARGRKHEGDGIDKVAMMEQWEGLEEDLRVVPEPAPCDTREALMTKMGSESTEVSTGTRNRYI